MTDKFDKLFDFNNTYENLPPEFYRKVELEPVRGPKLLYLNKDLSDQMGISYDDLKEYGLSIFSGKKFPKGASSIAQAYMGHQFGHQTMLGDGRAVLVGEIIDKNGNRIDIQLKGSGRTPYSRGGDGKANLGPMLKEYLFSEGMNALGIDSSRSLAITLTGEKVFRNGFFDGAILTRVMNSHIRIGTFEFAFYDKNPESLKILADYAIDRHYPYIKDIDDGTSVYFRFFKEVAIRQIKAVAKWMKYGFVHGVMNTDNTSISGETFDYGPCAFIDEYNPDSVYSSIDSFGRYSYLNQPKIIFWNLGVFAKAILPLVEDEDKEAVSSINNFLQSLTIFYKEEYYKEMAKKIGFEFSDETIIELIDKLLKIMYNHRFDYTNTFYNLTYGNLDSFEMREKEMTQWRNTWEKVLEEYDIDKNKAIDLMKSNNPVIIPRNYWVDQSIKLAEMGDFDIFERFLKELKNPFEDNEEKTLFKEFPDDFEYITYCGT